MSQIEHEKRLIRIYTNYKKLGRTPREPWSVMEYQEGEILEKKRKEIIKRQGLSYVSNR